MVGLGDRGGLLHPWSFCAFIPFLFSLQSSLKVFLVSSSSCFLYETEDLIVIAVPLFYVKHRLWWLKQIFLEHDKKKNLILSSITMGYLRDGLWVSIYIVYKEVAQFTLFLSLFLCILSSGCLCAVSCCCQNSFCALFLPLLLFCFHLFYSFGCIFIGEAFSVPRGGHCWNLHRWELQPTNTQ